MAEPKASSLIQEKDAGVLDDHLAAPQTKRLLREPTSDIPSEKRLKMATDEDSTANISAFAHQATNNNSPPNSEAPLNPDLWTDSAREVYHHLKDRAEKLEDASIVNTIGASTSKKDTPKSDAPSEDGTRGNIYETLLGRIQSTLKQLHDQQKQEEMKQPSADPTTSCPITGTDPSPSSPSITSNDDKHLPSPCAKASAKPSSSSTKRKRSKRKRSGPSMRIFAVKGTKAERLAECLKYFPKPPSPTPSPPSSPGSSASCSLSSAHKKIRPRV